MVASNCNGHWLEQDASCGLLVWFKGMLRARFGSPHYRKELLLELQRLQQGPKSVDEYYKDL